MSYSRVGLLGVCLAMVIAIIATDVSTVSAQPSLGLPKGRPYYGWRNQRAARSMRHARDYSRDLYQYSRGAATVEPEVVKSESEQLGQNIEAAKREIAAVRKQAGDDKETLTALEVIEHHLANAASTHKMLHAECCKDSVDGSVCSDCCNKITKELEKAMAEHAALMRRLEAKAKTDSLKEGN